MGALKIKLGTGTVVGLNWTLVESKMFTFTLECMHFICNKCPIYTHDGANANLTLIETKRPDYSVVKGVKTWVENRGKERRVWKLVPFTSKMENIYYNIVRTP